MPRVRHSHPGQRARARDCDEPRRRCGRSRSQPGNWTSRCPGRGHCRLPCRARRLGGGRVRRCFGARLAGQPLGEESPGLDRRGPRLLDRRGSPLPQSAIQSPAQTGLRARRHEQSRRRRHSRGRTSLARFLPPADLPFPGGHPLQDHDVSARRPRRATKHRSPAPPGRRPSTRRRTCRQRAQRAQTRENPARTCELTVRLVRPLNLLRCEPFGGSRGIPRASARRNMRPTRYPAVRETVVRTGGQRAVLRRPSDPTKCRDRESVTSMALRSRPVAPSIILSTPSSTRPSICAQAVDRTASLLRSITLRIRRVTLSEPFLPS